MPSALSAINELEKRAGGRLSTPFILLDEERVAANYHAVRSAFDGRASVFFAVKANNDPLVLHAIEKAGGNFDVASAGEVHALRDMGVDGSRIAFSNPMKIPDHVAYAYGQGVRLYAVDTQNEVDKVAALAPGSEVYVRLHVSNVGSGWPLAGKFGVLAEEAADLLERARKKGLRPAGVTFHVGSQCVNVDNWRSAIAECAKAWRAAASRGISLDLLDLGGGLPAPYGDGVPSVSEIAAAVRRSLAEMIPGVKRLLIEPGRFIVADAGAYVATVIGKAKRGGEMKVFLDASLFTGLMEAYEAFWYPIECLTGNAGPAEKVTLVGPTCDSVDIIVKDVMLPPLSPGDRVVFHRAGAYTNSYENYNGFRFPRVRSACGLLDK